MSVVRDRTCKGDSIPTVIETASGDCLIHHDNQEGETYLTLLIESPSDRRVNRWEIEQLLERPQWVTGDRGPTLGGMWIAVPAGDPDTGPTDPETVRGMWFDDAMTDARKRKRSVVAYRLNRDELAARELTAGIVSPRLSTDSRMDSRGTPDTIPFVIVEPETIIAGLHNSSFSFELAEFEMVTAEIYRQRREVINRLVHEAALSVRAFAPEY